MIIAFGAVVVVRSEAAHSTGAWLTLAIPPVVLATTALATFIPLPKQGAIIDLGCGLRAIDGAVMGIRLLSHSA